MMNPELSETLRFLRLSGLAAHWDEYLQQAAEANDIRAKLHTLTQERDSVRLRVERMLRQMDELV